MAMAKRGKIGEDEEEVLQENTEHIKDVLEAKDVTGYLLDNGILDIGQRQEIDTGYTKQDRATRLLKMIVDGRGTDAFSVFIAALRKNGYKTLGDQLDKGHISIQINDRLQMENLEKELQVLKDRVDHLNKHIQEEGANKSDVQRVYHDVSSALEELKEISIVSRATVSTIVDMQHILKQKDAELAKARKKIAVLERKILKLEGENTVLTEQMKNQTARVAELEVHISESDKKFDGLAKTVEEQNKKQNIALASIQSSMQQDRQRRVPISRGLKGNAITPRHRFQKN